MYFTKLKLDHTTYRVQKELGNPYQLHRTIMHAFPDNLEDIDRKGRVLFRVEESKKALYPHVLIQSSLCPNWDFLIGDNNYLVSDPVFKQFKFPSFQKGNIFVFRLYANPTKKTNGNRVGMYRDEDIYAWLHRKAELSGFKVIHVYITKKEEVTARVNKKSKTMTFQAIQFEGTLQVIDPSLFHSALIKGIGSGKSFGFGLLSIAKPS